MESLATVEHAFVCVPVCGHDAMSWRPSEIHERWIMDKLICEELVAALQIVNFFYHYYHFQNYDFRNSSIYKQIFGILKSVVLRALTLVVPIPCKEG